MVSRAITQLLGLPTLLLSITVAGCSATTSDDHYNSSDNVHSADDTGYFLYTDDEVDSQLVKLLTLDSKSCPIERVISTSVLLQVQGRIRATAALRRFVRRQSEDLERPVFADDLVQVKALLMVVRLLYRGDIGKTGIDYFDSVSDDCRIRNREVLPFILWSDVPFYAGIDVRGFSSSGGMTWGDVLSLVDKHDSKGQFAERPLRPKQNPVLAAHGLLASGMIIAHKNVPDVLGNSNPNELVASIRRQAINWAVQRKIIGRNQSEMQFTDDREWPRLCEMCSRYTWDSEQREFRDH